MPSPIAHALGGFSAGWLTAGESTSSRVEAGAIRSGAWREWRWPAVFTLVGMAPDLDLLVGQHHAVWHSLGAALIVSAATLVTLGPRRWRLASAVGAAYASHVLLDWLGEDSAPPIGVMALWPWSQEYFIAPFNVFRGISRQYWDPAAWSGNALSIAVELLVMGPVTALVCWRKGVLGRQRRHDGNERSGSRERR